MAPELMASDDIAPEVIAPEVIAPEVMASEVMASEVAAADVDAAAAEVLLVAVSEPDPQAASVRARAAPATRVRARFINMSVAPWGYRRRRSAPKMVSRNAQMGFLCTKCIAVVQVYCCYYRGNPAGGCTGAEILQTG